MTAVRVIIYISICSFIPSLIRSSPQRCIPDSRHHAAYGHWASRANGTDRLSLLVPSVYPSGFRAMNEEALLESIVPMAGSTDCPSAPLSAMDEPLMGRSTCPWYWKMNYDPQRIPAMLPEAVCRCHHAVVGARGVGPYECQPLTMRIRVLEMDESCENYYERTTDVAVACVSVLQSAVRLNKASGVEHVYHPQRQESLIEI